MAFFWCHVYSATSTFFATSTYTRHCTAHRHTRSFRRRNYYAFQSTDSYDCSRLPRHGFWKIHLFERGETF